MQRLQGHGLRKMRTIMILYDDHDHDYHEEDEHDDDGTSGVMQRLQCHGLNKLLAAPYLGRDGWLQLSQVWGA